MCLDITLNNTHCAYKVEDGRPKYNLVWRYMSAGQDLATEVAFAAATKYLWPEDAETATNLGVGYFICGKLDHAVKLLQQAVGFDPCYTPARYHLGRAYMCQGQYQEAVRSLEIAVLFEPGHAYAAIHLGLAYHATGRVDMAHAVLAAVRRRWPDCPEVLLALACAYRAGEQPCAALDCLARVLALASTDADLAWRARRLLTAIEYEESTAHSRV
jgi:tetratricopeptide (TPR) repeat protein